VFVDGSYPEKNDAELSARGPSASLSLSVTELLLIWDGDYKENTIGFNVTGVT